MMDIPQRYQTAGITALSAGIRLVPFNFMVAFGTAVVNIIAAKTRITPIALLLFGIVCQTIGTCLLAFMNYVDEIPSAIYRYQVITGLGIGFIFGLGYVLPPAVIEIKDHGKLFPIFHLSSQTQIYLTKPSPLRRRRPAIPRPRRRPRPLRHNHHRIQLRALHSRPHFRT